MQKNEFLKKTYDALKLNLSSPSLLIINEYDDYPDSMSLVILSESFEKMHEVDVSNRLLAIFRDAHGSDLYNGIYSFIGLTKKSHEARHGDVQTTEYLPPVVGSTSDKQSALALEI